MSVRLNVPHFVYRCYDEDGDLLYVGCSGDVEKRLAIHAKTASWVADVRNMEVEEFDSRRDALHAESRAIAAEHPYHNIVGRWMRRNEWTEAEFQRWAHMQIRRWPNGYDSVQRHEQMEATRRAYLQRFGKSLPDDPQRGQSRRRYAAQGAAA